MKKDLENSFPKIVTGGCLETKTETIFHIYDSLIEPKRCFIKIKDEDPLHFTVTNPLQKEVHFLAIDKCVLTDADKTHCDCAIFDDSQFLFVEISDSKKLHRNEKRKKAKDQLSQTITHFRENGIDFPPNLNAVICFVGKKIYPARSASTDQASVAFFKKWHAVLLEGNEREF